MLIPKLETERLILREWREGDFEIYSEMMGDIDVVRYLSGNIMGRGEAWRQMASMAGHWMLRGYGYWAVEEKSSGAFVGRVGLWYPDSWPGLEVGWTIAKSHWGKGYAPEAGAVAMDYAFQTQNLGELISIIHRENKNSMRVAEKLGEKLLRHTTISSLPCVIYGISRAEWKAKRTAI